MGATPLTNGTNWATRLTDAAAGGGGRNLTVEIRHVMGTGTPPAGPTFTFNFNGIMQPALGLADLIGRLEQRNHVKEGVVAKDIVSAAVLINAAGTGDPQANVYTLGRHAAVTERLNWSLHNPAGKPPLTGVTIVPSYRDVVTNMIFDGPPIAVAGTVPAGQTAGGLLPPTAVSPGGNAGRLSDYRVTATGSGTTSTTLAFPGLVDDVLTEADIAEAAALFFGRSEFQVPMFTSGDSMDPLFIAVDLGEWLRATSLSSSYLPTVDEPFEIMAGEHPELPGFLFSRSAVSFVAGTGWVTAGPLLSADVVTRGFIDGMSVPEASSFVLLGVGVLSSMLGRRRTQSR
jgi:hypothetical protein